MFELQADFIICIINPMYIYEIYIKCINRPGEPGLF